MTFRPLSFGLVAATVILLGAGPAIAQVTPTTSSPVRVSVLTASTGIASVADDAGLALGASASWIVSDRWGLEIGGTWLKRPGDQEALAVQATAQYWLRSSGRALPYLRAGLAAYAMTLDTSDAAPEFYRARLDAADTFLRNRHTFTDPALVIGGGVDVQVSRSVHLRPAMQVLAVMRNGDRLIVPMASMDVAYHFDVPVIAPRRGR